MRNFLPIAIVAFTLVESAFAHDQTPPSLDRKPDRTSEYQASQTTQFPYRDRSVDSQREPHVGSFPNALISN